MGRIVVTEFISLDGVFEDPGGAEGYQHGGWSFKFDQGQEGGKFKLDELMASDAQLLGRLTYEGFAKAWPAMPFDAASGRTPPAFFSSVVPASATWPASATCAGVVTGAEVEPVLGWLKRWYWNIAVRIRCTMVFSALFGMVPFSTAVCSAVP
jgi:hypothetical protein